MTEDEAKTRLCPKSATFNASGAWPWSSVENDDVTPAYCVASGCMAWRTRHQWLDNAQQEPDWVNYEPYAFEPGEGQERDDGYCGLAGEPR